MIGRILELLWEHMDEGQLYEELTKIEFSVL